MLLHVVIDKALLDTESLALVQHSGVVVLNAELVLAEVDCLSESEGELSFSLEGIEKLLLFIVKSLLDGLHFY